MAEYIKRTDALRVVDEVHGAKSAYHRIRDIPAADVTPVVHGQWIETIQENGCSEWTEFRCSVCGAVFDGNEWLFDKWKGCPMCLTRMDGE